MGVWLPTSAAQGAAGVGFRHGLCYGFGVSRFFNPNLDFRGRLVRGVLGALLLIAGIVVADFELWVCLPLVAMGLFGLFEAFRGWCFMRACGVKTRF